jgi:hypothetical protein
LTTAKVTGDYDCALDEANRRWTKANVWIIARPLDLPDYISFISRGRLPFCHWGVLVSPRDRWELENEWFGMEQKEPGARHSLLGTWGNLYELWRDPLSNKNTPNVTTDFGPSDVVEEWTYAVIHYVGKTETKPTEISEACPFKSPKKADSSKGNYSGVSRLRWLYQQLSEFRTISPEEALPGSAYSAKYQTTGSGETIHASM